jgi:hypothetical protein
MSKSPTALAWSGTSAPVASVRTANMTIAHSGPIGHIQLIIDSNGPYIINALLLSQVHPALPWFLQASLVAVLERHRSGLRTGATLCLPVRPPDDGDRKATLFDRSACSSASSRSRLHQLTGQTSTGRGHFCQTFVRIASHISWSGSRSRVGRPCWSRAHLTFVTVVMTSWPLRRLPGISPGRRIARRPSGRRDRPVPVPGSLHPARGPDGR